jgi:predicted amidohydrolase
VLKHHKNLKNGSKLDMIRYNSLVERDFFRLFLCESGGIMQFRVSAVQYHLHTIHSFEDFAKQVEHYIKTAEEYGSDFIVFPEFFTTQLMSIGNEEGQALTIQDLPDFTEQYRLLFIDLAKRTGMHIIGGTHVIRKGDKLFNVAHLFYPDGKVAEQAKLHITPTEVNEWNMSAGDSLEVFETNKGTIAMLTCYDIEFPEIVRMAKAKGADVIFCPSCTDDRHGFHRVRYTSHARAIENQVYVVTTGTVGSLPTVDFMRANFGQAVVITPNDIPFPPQGIMVEGEINQDMIVTADLNLELLYKVRESGSVTTWRDRRSDLYPDWEKELTKI